MGFSVARRLGYMPDRHLKEAQECAAKIMAKEFDLIIYGNAWRGLPLWWAVTKAGYTKDQVLALNGEDWHGWKQVESQHKQVVQQQKASVRGGYKAMHHK